MGPVSCKSSVTYLECFRVAVCVPELSEGPSHLRDSTHFSALSRQDSTTGGLLSAHALCLRFPWPPLLTTGKRSETTNAAHGERGGNYTGRTPAFIYMDPVYHKGRELSTHLDDFAENTFEIRLESVFLPASLIRWVWVSQGFKNKLPPWTTRSIICAVLRR